MEPQELLKILEGGEGTRTEFKQRFSTFEKMAKEMIALANSRGGFLIVGIEDDGRVTGVQSEKSEAELLKQTASEYCEPPINITIHFVELYEREIVVAEIGESLNKPHRLQDYLPEIDLNRSEVFIRVNDKSVPAGKEMIKILQARTSEKPLKNYKVGKIERQVFQYLEKYESITVKNLCDAANISNRRASRTLIQLVRAELLNIHVKDNGENYFTSSV